MENKRQYQQEVKNKFASKFIEKRTIPLYTNYNAVEKYKSIRRAIKRGKVDLYTGIASPPRPFNNRKYTLGKDINRLKQSIYEQYKQRQV